MDENRSMNPKTPARILIVDDHSTVRRTLRNFLEAEEDFEVCAEAEASDEAMRAIERTKPNLVLLDLSLGDSNGLSLAKSIRASHAELPILILSLHSESIFANAAIHVGANGYLMKSEASEHLVEAIRCVLRGELYMSENMRQVKAISAKHGLGNE